MADEKYYNGDDNNEELENENEEVLNAAYDRVSSSGMMPDLESFLGSEYNDPLAGASQYGDELGNVIGDPVFSDQTIDMPDGEAGGEAFGEEESTSTSGIKSILDGSFIGGQTFAKHLPYVLLCIILSVLYIGNRNSAEFFIKKNMVLQREVRELRAESIMIAAKLMSISKETEVSHRVEEKHLGIHEVKVPPFYFVIDKFERADSLLDNDKNNRKNDYYNDYNDFEDVYKKIY